jgi:hypothetical protein
LPSVLLSLFIIIKKEEKSNGNSLFSLEKIVLFYRSK